MRKLLAVLLLSSFASVSFAEGITCEDVDQLGDSLNQLGIALADENMEIGEGSPEHQQLAELSLHLATIADTYQDEELAQGSVAMAEAWANNDRDGFTEGLATVVNKLAVVYQTQCQ